MVESSERLDLASLSEERVAQLALAGQRAAWDVLIARHGRRVLLSLLARGVRVDRAQDLAQETWMRLIEQQRAGKLTRLELPGLAVTQASFLAADEARKATASNEDALAGAEDPAASVEVRFATRQDLDRALAELERCPARAREVFALVYDNPALSHAEAAQRAGLSVQRLRQTLCEVRARLRAAMEAEQ